MYSKNEINELINTDICDFLKIMQDSVYIEFRALLSTFKEIIASDILQMTFIKDFSELFSVDQRMIYKNKWPILAYNKHLHKAKCLHYIWLNNNIWKKDNRYIIKKKIWKFRSYKWVWTVRLKFKTEFSNYHSVWNDLKRMAFTVIIKHIIYITKECFG